MTAFRWGDGRVERAHLRPSRIAIGRLICQVQKGSRQLRGTNIPTFRGHQMRDRNPHPSNHTTTNSSRCGPHATSPCCDF